MVPVPATTDFAQSLQNTLYNQPGYQKITPYIDPSLTGNVADDDARLLLDHVKKKDAEMYPRGPLLFDEYIDNRRAQKEGRGELPKHKYRARNQFRSRLPSASSLQERRRSFKAKRRPDRSRGWRAAAGSSLERDPEGTADLSLSDRSQRLERTRTPPRNRRASATGSSLGGPSMRRAYECAFGTSQRRDANFGVEKRGPKPATKYGLGGSVRVHKPVKNQTIGAFLKTCNMLYQKGEYERCKKKTEEALKEYDRDKDPING